MLSEYAIMSNAHAAIAALLLATALSPAEATLVIDRLEPPGGALTGAPGDLLGWGFTIANDSDSEWLVLSASSFDAVPGWGTYTDFVGSRFILLGPKERVTEAFDAVGSTGAGSFLIDALANPGETVSGYLVLTYDGFDANPLEGGEQILFSQSVEGAASVTVRHPQDVPEPNTAALLAFAALGAARRRVPDTM